MSYQASHFTTWRGWVWRVIALIFVKIFLKLRYPYTISGQQNIPKIGPYIIAANHISLLDPPLVAISVGYPIAFMAKKELFSNRLARFFFRLVGTFALNRDTPDITTIKTALNVLRSPGKWALCLFPEGTRNQTGQVLPFKKGVVSIAHKANVPILPVGIRKQSEDGKFVIKIGKLIEPDEDTDKMQTLLYTALLQLTEA